MSESTTLLKKLTTRSLGYTGPIIKKLLGEAETVHLYNIAGRAGSYKMTDNNFGDQNPCFIGSFAGIIVSAPNDKVGVGEEFRSGKSYLPSVLEGLLQTAVDGAEGGLEDFAFEVWAAKMEKGVGYEFNVKPTVKIAESDELAELANKARPVQALPDKSATKKK